MGYKKSILKRQYILDCAAQVFSQKGFAKVTMSDIQNACQISRGGLYRYFGSTSQIFLAVFAEENEREIALIETAKEEGQQPRKILIDLLNFHRAVMLGEHRTLALAAYEFFIEGQEEQLIRRWQFDNLAETLRELIVHGIEKKDFNPVDPAAWGRHLAYFIEGMKLMVPILDLPEGRVDEELNLLLAPLLAKNET